MMLRRLDAWLLKKVSDPKADRFRRDLRVIIVTDPDVTDAEIRLTRLGARLLRESLRNRHYARLSIDDVDRISDQDWVETIGENTFPRVPHEIR